MESSHRPADEEFYIPFPERGNNAAEFLRLAQCWQHHYNARRPHFGAGMSGLSVPEKGRALGLDHPEEFALFPVVLLEEAAMIWAVGEGHHLLAHYTN